MMLEIEADTSNTTLRFAEMDGLREQGGETQSLRVRVTPQISDQSRKPEALCRAEE